MAVENEDISPDRTRAAIDGLLRAVHEDLTGESWTGPLAAIAYELEAVRVDVYVFPKHVIEPRLYASSEADRRIHEEYLKDFAASDPRIPRILAGRGTAFACWQIIPPEELDRAPIVTDFLGRPDVDLRWAMAAAREMANGVHVLITAARGRSQGRFEPAIVGAFGRLVRHVMHVLDLQSQLADARRFEVLANSLSEALPQGVICVDRNRDIAFANAMARTMLGSAEHVVAQERRFAFLSPQAQKALEGLLADPRPGRWSSRAPLGVSMTSVPDIVGQAPHAVPQIKVLIRLDRRSAQADSRLTKREREVAELIVAGQSLSEIAQASQKSRETIRTQLKSVMRKLGVRTQAQLVRAYMLRRLRAPGGP